MTSELTIDQSDLTATTIPLEVHIILLLIIGNFFFLYVSPIWLLQEKTTGKDRTCDIYRGYREELALGEVWRGYSTKEGY